MDATYELVRNFHRTTYGNLPTEVVDFTRKEILDTLAVTFAGPEQPGPKQLANMMKRWGGR